MTKVNKNYDLQNAREVFEVPLAMAEAFRNGQFGIMDYYKMRNIEADTDMRDSISKSENS